ncbi:MAG: glutamate--tRNA ligase [Clostridiales bacterium]|jgi:glutamyl-tRNA synthetase|nr:glutamate--tRNA ligase [Clostridiales bacterium]MCI2161975.1 glutamate--tRNA ligase [Oscillospiraceae bacterium]MCI1960398.1 glutamate--tRNA ligase [Clostridiales bacterium]MCI2020885.1 glutamate--tRNA ligase [Clostridiales bacterium]MCI2025268.1 glutamate--tRNA ligase [Clostridiales bacterium]
MEKTIVRTRFAPSPTGFMHVGNLRTALYAYLVAKSKGGKFILRIEDTDQERLVPGAVDVIYHTLQQVGLQHDEGPDLGGEYGPYIQSERKNIYLPYAEKLVEEGKAYYCFCTKERLESLHQENTFGGYDRHCRNLPKEEVQRLLDMGTPWVIRQKMPLEGSTTFVDSVFGEITIENKMLEDQVLIKSDGYPTYNFANVIDDHLMHITHVVRGCEYLTSTPKYNLLYEAFGWEVPVYVHLPLIMGRNADGTTSKLSKRHGSTGFADLIKEGYLPETIVNYIALLGWAPKDNCEIYSLQELCNAFSLDGISKSPAVFDYEKLTWMNGEYIHKMPKEEFIREATPYFKEVFGENLPDTEILADILQPRVLKFTEVPQMLQFFKELQDYPTDFFINKKSKATLENAPVMLQKSIDLLSSLEDWSVPSLHDKLLQLAKDLEVKNGTLLWPVRIAAAGQTVTPGGAMEILSILGKKESLRRLTLGLEKLKA